MHIENILQQYTAEAIHQLYGATLPPNELQIQETRKEFEGNFTLVVFPLLKVSKQSPEATAKSIGDYLQTHCPEVAKYNVIKGFLNLIIKDDFWIRFITDTIFDNTFGCTSTPVEAPLKMIEYSSPNTNKPLHLGHVRNNLLGFSLYKILTAAGHSVVKVNLVNDRGIHICKSMLAWQKWGNGETPETSGKKGDHLVGEYYVRFDIEYKKEIDHLKSSGMNEEEAARKAPLILEAQDMLRRWEAKDPEIIALWERMNHWVYEGFDKTYQRMGVDFDRIYYESQTYLQGKDIVIKGLEKGIFYKKEDGSVWVDLTSDGLDEKLLLRSDGTSVYITQDIGTACQRFDEYPIDELVYVVGNEQNYHFQVLSFILGKLGYSWAKNLKHMSYGMVELPKGMGKMKSREGTVVDADDLMDEMVDTARDMSRELGKLDGLTDEEADGIVEKIGMGALKYFILKVDPQKNMVFNPKESIDFNGNTGPFIQYTYARIQSVMRKVSESGLDIKKNIQDIVLNNKEVSLTQALYNFPRIIQDAAETYSPALIANYVYDLSKEYNQFYHDYSILKEENVSLRDFRIMLSQSVGQVIYSAMDLLGIDLPDRM